MSTIIDMGGGVWRARTPDGEARTFDDIPPDVDDVPLWIAQQLTDEQRPWTRCPRSARE